MSTIDEDCSMAYSSDPRSEAQQPPENPQTGQTPHAQNASSPSPVPTSSPLPPQISARLLTVIPADKKLQRARSQVPPATRQLRKRIAWYAVCVAAILSIVLGFALAVPLSTGQNKSVTLVQGISNLLTTGHFSNLVVPGQGTQTQNTTNALPDRLFSADSPWNMPVGTNVELDPNSNGMVNNLVNGNHVPTLFQYGMPIYVSTASDPLYTVPDDDRTFMANNPFHIPNTAAPSPGTDKWMFVYDSTKHMLFEMWEANKSGNTWTAQAGNVFSLTGDGVHQIDGTQTGGNGASYFGGVIRASEIQRGYINHALSLGTAYTAATWRYPMSRSDGHGTDANDLPMGARLQLDPSVNCEALPHASVGEKLVCQALQTYGGYIRDTAGPGVALSIYFEGEDLGDPARNPPMGSPGNPGRPNGAFGKIGLFDQQEMPDIPWSKLRVLKAWNSFTVLSNTPPAMLLTSFDLFDYIDNTASCAGARFFPR